MDFMINVIYLSMSVALMSIGIHFKLILLYLFYFFLFALSKIFSKIYHPNLPSPFSFVKLNRFVYSGLLIKR